jgi:hypothetical protein
MFGALHGIILRSFHVTDDDLYIFKVSASINIGSAHLHTYGIPYILRCFCVDFESYELANQRCDGDFQFLMVACCFGGGG